MGHVLRDAPIGAPQDEGKKWKDKMSLLEVKDLKVRVEDREILHGLTLTVNPGEVHAIMGPNGSGKSTLSHVIAGKPGYEVTGGEVLFRGEDLLEMAPDVRAAKGVFLAFQYPVEIPGVATMTFLRTALNAQRKARGESEYSTPDFLKKVREVAKSLNIPQDMLRRGVNVGFSGGEKKRNEILQMALFEHEATTSKISEDVLFYCVQRGLSQEEAVGLVVNGFVKDVLQQLPMEFAVEAQKLISISLEGSVG